jgi:hypothetical protein
MLNICSENFFGKFRFLLEVYNCVFGYRKTIKMNNSEKVNSLTHVIVAVVLVSVRMVTKYAKKDLEKLSRESIH